MVGLKMTTTTFCWYGVRDGATITLSSRSNARNIYGCTHPNRFTPTSTSTGSGWNCNRARRSYWLGIVCLRNRNVRSKWNSWRETKLPRKSNRIEKNDTTIWKRRRRNEKRNLCSGNSWSRQRNKRMSSARSNRKRERRKRNGKSEENSNRNG